MTPSEISKMANLRSDAGMQIEIVVALLYNCLANLGDTVVDGGASGGGHTLGLAKVVGPKGRVFSFEASPRARSWLPKHYKESGHGDIITFVNKALFDYPGGVLEFVLDNANSGLNHLRRPDEAIGESCEMVTVDVTTLDSEIPPSEKVSFIKLDVEGVELQAMRGAKRIIARDRPIIVFENGKNAPVQDYFSFMKEVGYESYDFYTAKITPDNYHANDLSFEAVCGPSGSLALMRARFILKAFWACLAERPVFTSFSDSADVWLAPLPYVVE